MHRIAGLRRYDGARNVLAVLLCLVLGLAAPALAQQKNTATVKAGQVVPLQPTASSPSTKSATAKPSQSETLPSAPPAKAPAETSSAKSGQTGNAAPAGAPGEMSTIIKEPADFNECVRVALAQSPMLVKSALEIESKRLDVQDAWGSFIPTIAINTTYWFRMPTKIDGTTDKPYTISFSTSQWNPILSGFDVKAKNQMTNMAVLGHLKVIGEGLKRLATDFIQLSAIQDQKGIVRKKEDLAKQNLEFFKTRLGLGQATQLDIRIAETKIQMAKAEDDKINILRGMVMDDVKFILGVPFTNKLNLDVAAAKKQILGKFSVADVTDEKVRAYSFDLRMQEYEKSLQKMNIGLSYVKLLPTFGFTFQTVDAFNNASGSTTKNEGFPFYPGINISMPLDYWTKGRDIARQYKKLDQIYAGAKAKEFELMVSVQKAMSDYQATSADLSLATSKMDLDKLQDEQTEYRYKTGQVDFDKFVADRSAYYESQQKMIMAQVKRDTALLVLKHLSGDLQGQYIDVATWEK